MTLDNRFCRVYGTPVKAIQAQSLVQPGIGDGFSNDRSVSVQEVILVHLQSHNQL
jgi:hypothetical protein